MTAVAAQPGGEQATSERTQTVCTWCEKAHPNPVTLSPFSLGTLARAMGPDAFGATCDDVNRAAKERRQ